LEYAWGLNSALNNFIPFIANSISAQSYIPYKGWDFVDLGNNTGRFEWTWDHPYFNDPSCPSDLLKIIISLSYKCNVSDSPQSIIADAHLPNILSQLRIFDISIQLTSDPSDLVFYSRPGLYCTGINGTYLNPTIHDMEQIAPLPFTNSHFAFGVNNSGDLIIDLASSPYDYYGTYFNVGSNTEDAYFMHWAMAHEYCDLPSDADPLPQLQTNYAFQACIPFYDLLPACPRNCPEFSAEICFDWQMTPVPKELELPTPLLCEDENTNQVLTSVTVQLQELISDQLNGHYQNYLDVCANPDNINDELKYGMELGYHHYTLFYYDRAGNLITTVPPEGVDLQDDPAPGNSFSRVSLDHRMKTEYHYNSLNQLTAQETPDGGLSHFTYNDIGQLRFSQNAQQQIDGTFSYTKYDELARIVEAGVCLGDFSLVSDPIYSNDNSYPQSNVSEVVQTTYSRPYADLAISQSFLQNRVSYSVRLGDNGEDDITTVYSYDAHGNVDKLYQIIPAIGIKCMQYEYDLVSGNVLKVAYQKGERDQFFHKYSYDSDNRIESAMTSRDGLLWDKDGSYDYYKHGPLKRTEIGEDKVQGLDFIYTLNGWLKSINHPSLMVSYDINEDGKHDSSIAKDVFGMQLNYFDGDYKRSNGYGIILDSSHPVTASIDNHRSLYNGNISSWFSQVTFPNSNNSSIEHNGKMIGYTYTYDELNRLVLAKFNHYSGSWNENFDYNSLYVYDANGNIEFLRRTGPSSDLFDDLTYHYHEVNGEKINNRLYHFKDDGVASAYDDLKDLPSNYDNANAETANNFRYDALGNLIQDDSEEIQLIDWLANGKIAAVLRPSGASGKSDLYFNYDALGNRISKKVVAKSNNYPLPESEWTWTYYVRDASGNIMATYDRIHSTTNEGYNKKIKWAESPIYGSSRLGVLSTNELLSDVDVNTSTGDEVELANYDIGSLGTVLVSIDDDNNTSTPIVVGGTAGQLNVLESYGSFTGTPSPAIYTQNDALGAIEFSIMGLNDNEECTIKILDANGVVMSGSELMNASTQSEIQVFPLDDIGLYQLFTLDTDQHLLQHKFNPSINGSGDVLVEHNVNIAPGRLFRSKMLAFENEGVNTLMVREKISGDNDQLVLFHFDRSNGNFINEENLGIPFESDDLDEDYGIRMTEDALKISFSSNSLIDEGRGTGQFHIYQRWNTSTAFDPMGVIQAKHNGEVGDVEFSANGAYLYYIEYTAYEVYLNQYALHTGAHEVIMEREVNGAASNLLLSNIGELYISNFNASALMSVTNSNQPAPSVSPGEEELVWGDQLLGISVNLPNIPIDLISAGLPFAYANRIIDNKKYELTDHLGNVRVVISDVKTHLQTDANGLPFEFEAIVLSASDYYPFGMLIPGREDQGANNNRFAFNGREKDDEIAGAGNFIIYMERGYDPRIARWKSVDGAASKYPSFSTYSFTLNNPIAHSEIDGNVIETGWDVFNVGLDIVSIGVNIYSGNYFDALVDVGALAYDVGATIVPGLPAGAGAALKASRAGRVVLKVIKHSDNLYKVGERAFRSANKAADYTKIVNDKFEGSVKLANAFWDAGKGGANKLAKALKTAGTGKKAHHIIPTTLLEKNKYVKQAVEEGFDFNGIVNGIGLDKTRHKGGHFDYTEAVNNMINKAFTNPKNADKSATEILQSVSTKLKSKIENSTGDINQLFTK
ncbi:MAG: AHH domain-containing protein, partial [Bacteroidota bacterium]